VTEQFNVTAAAPLRELLRLRVDHHRQDRRPLRPDRRFRDPRRVSTGFRAPALQQSFFTATAINFIVINGVSTPTEVATLPATDPDRGLARAPASSIPEESVNTSWGSCWTPGPFELTVDAYRIEITDRIVLSENLLGNPTGQRDFPGDLRAPEPPGSSGTLGGGRFFINGVDTETKGLDVVARYRLPYSASGRLDFTLAGNFNETKVTRVPAIPSNIPIPNPPALFDRINVLTFEEGTPREKIVFSTDLSDGPVGGTLRFQYYSDVFQPFSNTNPAFDVHTDDNVLIDVEGRYKLFGELELAVGANNLFDNYPDFTPAFVNTTGATAFTNYSPFGFNGRYLYARIGYRW
jgi:iron complex outermembrane receptor protein